MKSGFAVCLLKSAWTHGEITSPAPNSVTICMSFSGTPSSTCSLSFIRA